MIFKHIDKYNFQ